MDFDIKYIIVAVGVLLIVAIVGHHVWRAWRVRQQSEEDDSAAERASPAALWDDEDRGPTAEQPSASQAAPFDADAREQEPETGAPAQRTEPHIAAPEAGDNLDEAPPRQDGTEPESASPEPAEVTEEVEESVSKARSVAGAKERPPTATEDRTRREARDSTDESVNEYVAIWVVAKDDERFSGDDLLRAFNDAKLEYGARNVFHRRDGSGSQFMVVNGTEPGTFDLAEMSEFSTPAVVATMTLPGPDDPIAAFNAMLTTARALEAALGGILKDEELNAMSYQTIEHCRSRVAEFARRQMSQRP